MMCRLSFPLCFCFAFIHPQSSHLHHTSQGLRFASGTDHMARTMSLVSQVFARILSQDPTKPDIDPDSPNSRFIVAENPSGEDAVITSLSRSVQLMCRTTKSFGQRSPLCFFSFLP